MDPADSGDANGVFCSRHAVYVDRRRSSPRNELMAMDSLYDRLYDRLGLDRRVYYLSGRQAVRVCLRRKNEMTFQEIIVGVIILVAGIYAGAVIWKKTKTLSPKSGCEADCDCGSAKEKVP